jgi:hypothetical protein
MSNGTNDCNTCQHYENLIDDLQDQISNRQNDINQNYPDINQGAPGSAPGQSVEGAQAVLDDLIRKCSDAVENYNRHYRSAHGTDAPARPILR